MLKANPASVPRSEKALGRADCLVGDAVGDIVRISAAKVGNRFQVEKIDISMAGHPPAVGVIVKKLAATDCIVQFHGPLRGTYAGLTPGIAYFAGTDSLPAKVGDPNYPAPGDPLQQAGVATSTNEVYLNFLDVGVASGLTTDRYNVKLSKVGSRTWTAPEFFTPTSIRVHHNGRRLELAVGSTSPVDGCFYVSESGGVGTGYDTVNLVRFSTNARSHMLADYVAVV